ncbi:hypothetical protein AOCH_000271 [Aspergillus ochraceoroseus]|uniref:Amino acid transporter n=1 Tax=Aspergillus ochraceoroseus TaxID=138278 RepID=A0A0F8UZ75_9EURO|nr:hypothetical protein AOCH_000271 [Aspergillus ochraceoroseus]
MSNYAQDSENSIHTPLLPDQQTNPAQQNAFARNLGAAEAFGVVVSVVIGSGIFTSTGAIDANVPSPGAALIVWLAGGILAWTGASTMAELGTTIPGQGGVQPYLQYIFGDIVGFLAAWTWILAIMPATLAIISIVFIESIYSALGVTDQAQRIDHKLLSILVLIFANVANCISTRVSTRLNRFFVATKFVSVLGIVSAAAIVMIIHLLNREGHTGSKDWYSRPWFGFRDTQATDGREIKWSEIPLWELLGHYSTALYGALWAYSGWDKAANAAYYVLLPWDVIPSTDSVAVTAMERLLGPGFGIVAAFLFCLVVAGSLLGNSFVAGRMVVAAAHQDWLPSFLGFIGHVRASARPFNHPAAERSISDAPLNAIILSTLLPIFYILLGNFRALLTFNGLGEYSFFCLTVLGAILLRFREPHRERPYKPFLLVPVVFALASGFVVIRGAAFAPFQACILLVLWLLGVAVYHLRKKIKARSA